MNFWMAATISGPFVGAVEMRHRLVSAEYGITESWRNSDHSPHVSSELEFKRAAVNAQRFLQFVFAIRDRGGEIFDSQQGQAIGRAP